MTIHIPCRFCGRFLPSATAADLLKMADRYEEASRYIQGFFYPERSKSHVIRDLRRDWTAQVIYDTDDEVLYRANLRIEYMRYAMECIKS